MDNTAPSGATTAWAGSGKGPSPHGSPTLNNAGGDSRQNAAGRCSDRRSPTRKAPRRRARARVRPQAVSSVLEASRPELSADRRRPAGSATGDGGGAARGCRSRPLPRSPALPRPLPAPPETAPGRSPPHDNRAPATQAPARAEKEGPAARATTPSPVRAHTSLPTCPIALFLPVSQLKLKKIAIFTFCSCQKEARGVLNIQATV